MRISKVHGRKASNGTVRALRNAALGLGMAIMISGATLFPAAAQAEPPADVIAVAKTESKVTIYTSTVDAEMQDIAKTLAARYPFIKAEWLRLTSTTIFTRFAGETAAKTYHADVLYSGSSQLYQQRFELFKTLTPDLVPDIAKVIVSAKNPNYAAGAALPPIVASNAQSVSQAEIGPHRKIWKDLTGPRWRAEPTRADRHTLPDDFAAPCRFQRHDHARAAAGCAQCLRTEALSRTSQTRSVKREEYALPCLPV